MNIELIPAIDLMDGKCVRLTQGDYHRKKVYGDDPVETAVGFERLGFKRLHVVDLDGARSSHVVNIDTLKRISASTGLIVDFGGGIKTDGDIERVFDAGAAMVTVGSVAVREPDRMLKWIQAYGAEKIVLGADVRNGRIAVNGWKDDSEEELISFLGTYVKAGITHVLCTEIARDGMLDGPAVDLYRNILNVYSQLHLIASGGVASNKDIAELERAGVPAVVFGKAFYEGKIDVEKLLHGYGVAE